MDHSSAHQRRIDEPLGVSRQHTAIRALFSREASALDNGEDLEVALLSATSRQALDEQSQMLALAAELHRRLAGELGFKGVNVGINCGEVAGQTVAHAHLHFVPRYRGDCADPAGGIRWLFRDKARYWAE